MSSAAAPLGFLFLSPLAALATAAAAVSVPVVIHLLSRRRYRVVTWAAMRFLLAAQKQSARKMRLEQLLLLAVRCALLLLLVLAMASVMPWAEEFWYRLFPGQAVLAAAGQQRTHKILVLDGSFSMALKTGDESCFDRARAKAIEILNTAAGSDGFSVVLLATPPQSIVPEPSDDARRVAEEVRKLRLPHGNGDLAATLNAVDAMLRRSPEKFEAREVYFLTDLQRATWGGPPTAELVEAMQRVQGKARVVVVDVGQDGATNLAVTNLSLGTSLVTTGTEVPVTATVHNYGGTGAKSVRVELLVGKARATAADPAFEPRVVAQEIVRVPPGRAGVAVTFKHKFAAPGEHAVIVRLERDALEVDDSRALVVTVKDSVPVMLVNGKPAVEPLDQATQFLRVALNPFDKGPVPRNVPARPRVVSESQFADATLGDLTPYDCVFLCDVARLGSAEVRRLETHLRRGGGVVFCLGPRVDLEAYNRLVFQSGQGILPVRLLGVQRAAEDRVFTFYAEEDAYRQPPLEIFGADADRASLLGARFRQYVRGELPPRSRARKILSFMPEPEKARAPDRGMKNSETTTLPVGDPAIVEWQRHRGRVVVVTSTVNMDWTSWPASPSFPVVMQELLKFAVAGRLHEQAALVVTPLEDYLPAGNVGIEFKVQTPDGRTVEGVTEAQDDLARMRFTETDQSGLYRITFGQNPREHLYAVNVPAATESQQVTESDPARVNRDDIRAAYPSGELQFVTDPKDVIRSLAIAGGDRQIIRGMGTQIARILLLVAFGLVLVEVLLAWRLGRYSKSAVPAEVNAASGRALPIAVALFFGIIFLVLAGVLLHAARTQDFLGFMPDRVRGGVESVLGVPQPVPGESTRWRLEQSSSLLRNAALEPWAMGAIALAAVALVLGVYHYEGKTASRPYRLLLAGLRVFFVLLLLLVMVPQLQVWFERQSWPDVAIVIDDSISMSAADQYRDPRVKEAADRLAQTANLSKPERLALAQALLTNEKYDWLGEMLARHKVKVHVFRCSGDVVRLADLTQPDHRDKAVEAVKGLKPSGEPSRLGGAVRQVLGQFRGSSLAALVMMTDGVTTDGEDILQSSRYAAQMGVPLYFIGLGDAHEVRDLILHDLQVEDTVFVNDRLVFEARLTAQGYTSLPPLTVTLSEKAKDGKLRRLKSEKVAIDPQGKPVKFRLTHQPTEPGEKVYVLEVPVQTDEVQPENNRLERTVYVREAKPSRVLYVEGYARPEFRFIKTLLERESTNERGNKSIELKVLLLDAQEDWHLQDKSARADFPTKEELNQFDVVILGDVDPKHPKVGEKNLRLLVDFVRERGGGLLLIAGKRDNPRSYKDTPLADVLPIQVVATPPPEDPDLVSREAFRPQLTPLGRLHPIFRFSPDEAENAAIWNHLAEIYWYADGYKLQPAAEVLAVHPKQKAIELSRPGAGGDERHPLIVQHFVGSGRCLFLGIEETWAWGFREDLLRFNQFWVQTVHYLARSRLGRVDLRLDRQTSYRRGEPIRVTVRFPDDSPPPGAGSAIKVLVERRPPKSSEIEVQTLQLAKLEGSRATYEALLTRTPEGDYRFSLSTPSVAPPKPRAECRVLPPPGEMERLRMNQPDMERAADLTHGRFYTLADAPRLLDELPAGNRVSLSTPGPPWRLWNHFALFALALGLLGAEWVLRKRKHLL